MFSRPKILFLVSLLFVALLNPKFNPYLLFKFLIFYHSSDILFYTGFPNNATLIACYNYFGPAVNHLVYWGSKEGQSSAHGRNRLLPPLEEYFMVLVRH